MLSYLQIIETEEDKSKFEQLYIKYRGLMFYVSNRILQNPQDAEDAVHLAFEAIARNMEKISEVSSPRTRAYAVTIAENKAIDLVRKRRRLSEQEMDEARIGWEIPLPGDGGLADAMARLPARYREILLLRYDCGYATDELAAALDLSREAVQKLIWRAKEALKQALEKEGMPL